RPGRDTRSGRRSGPCSPRAPPTRRAQALKSLLDFARLETPGADVGPARNPVHENADALEVRVEPPLRGHHGVAPVVSERGSFPADCADLRHKDGQYSQ